MVLSQPQNFARSTLIQISFHFGPNIPQGDERPENLPVADFQ